MGWRKDLGKLGIGRLEDWKIGRMGSKLPAVQPCNLPTNLFQFFLQIGEMPPFRFDLPQQPVFLPITKRQLLLHFVNAFSWHDSGFFLSSRLGMVPGAGFEPAKTEILSPACLPLPPTRLASHECFCNCLRYGKSLARHHPLHKLQRSFERLKIRPERICDFISFRVIIQNA